MNKTVDLVTRWTGFEEKFPGASIEDFCRKQLSQSKENKHPEKLFEGKTTAPREDIILLKLLGRITWYQSFYTEIAMEGLEIKKVEEFYFLNYIRQVGNPIKTEVIYQYVHTFSTGLYILDGLIQKGYIKETGASKDKRSKRVSITAKGQKVLAKSYERFAPVVQLLTFDLPLEDIKLCIQLLGSIDTKFDPLWKKHRGKSLSKIYEQITGKSL